MAARDESIAECGVGRDADDAPTATRTMARGRGARTNASGRFENEKRFLVDDGWRSLADRPALKTEVFEERPKSLINRNSSPDLGFELSINPYRGCEHGCAYCYARPAHAYVGLSPGLDFESKLFAKPNAPEILRRELAAPGYRPSLIVLGGNTDAYQPVERNYGITRGILEVLEEFNNPVGIVTKSALVLRDLDILRTMAERNLVNVAVSVTTLDGTVARKMEPRAATPAKRLRTLEALAAAGVPTTVMVAPVIPAINDGEIEAILRAASEAGARHAGYVLLRLPRELKDLFREWLGSEFPDRAGRVLSLLQSMREGRDYDPTFGRRMKGVGPYARSLQRRFEVTAKRLGLNGFGRELRTDLFRRPPRSGEQLDLL